MSDVTRDGLNTVLTKQATLQIYSRQKIDFLREKRGLSEIEAAEQLGISKMISATLSGTASSLALEVQVIDIKTGLIEASHEGRGSEQQLIEMQNDAAIEVMRSLKVPIDEDLARLLARRTNDRLVDYKLLTESMGGGGEARPTGKDPQSRIPAARWLAHLAPRDARADADEAAIRALLERYRLALESESMAEVEALHVAMPEPMRDALRQYFENAKRLRVTFSKVDILVEGDEALATFTRSDDFVDATSGMPVHLEVRVSNVVARKAGEWRIQAIKKPA
jgi:ketosteroid isomerase-like protein